MFPPKATKHKAHVLRAAMVPVPAAKRLTVGRALPPWIADDVIPSAKTSLTAGTSSRRIFLIVGVIPQGASTCCKEGKSGLQGAAMVPVPAKNMVGLRGTNPIRGKISDQRAANC